MAQEKTKWSADEVAMTVRRLGHTLSQEEFDALCDALGYVAAKARRVREGLHRSDEPASAFRVVAED